MLAPDASQGTLRTGGAIELLQLGAGQVFHQEFWFELAPHSALAEVDIEPAPPFAGKLGRIGVFDLGVGSISADPRARTITVNGAPLTLNAQTAAHFNEAFARGKATFAAGERFGAVSFTAQAQ